ncbi:ASKHA domain-containing protein [Catenibacillus scindens]|uniref:ASKHA domain-containing protein n=1 Tax=Catenibacillus scindens TaxID=673271 RepID=UPI003207D83F
MVKITIADGKTEKVFGCVEGDSILVTLRKNNVYVPAYCDGRGTCKKCRVRLIEGELPVTDEDAAAFTLRQLEEGWRLSCRAFPEKDCVIVLETQKEEDFEVLGGRDKVQMEGAPEVHRTKKSDGHLEKADLDNSEARAFGVAVDVGTTTIAMELVDLKDGQVLAWESSINHQRAYGADVISRIQASVAGLGSALKKSVWTDLIEGVAALEEKAGILSGHIEKMTVAANTTMIHLLMGYSCETLGVAPFTPVTTDPIHSRIKEAAGDVLSREEILKYGKMELIILPGISTYVGADIVAGMLVCGFDQIKAPAMLIDLGTNGEMVIGGRTMRVATSTAAGPAFEGGNISWGTGSVGGAICAVSYKDGEMAYETIGNKPPVGICGTGVLDIAAELVGHGLVDETGLLDEDYFDIGVKIADGPGEEPITFTQKDIREIQLAKAAVRAGINVLLKRYGTNGADLAKVYLAGGFGFRLNIDKAVAIGLLPESFSGKITVVGNASLKGARMCLLDENLIGRAWKMAGDTQEISLGNDGDFNEYFMEAMYFER